MTRVRPNGRLRFLRLAVAGLVVTASGCQAPEVREIALEFAPHESCTDLPALASSSISIAVFGIDDDGECLLARRCLSAGQVTEIADLISVLASARQPLIDLSAKGAEKIAVGVHLGLGCRAESTELCAVEDLLAAEAGVLELELQCNSVELPMLCVPPPFRFCETFLEPVPEN